ncbi:MAG: CRISPR-associated endonuclease Cas2 [Gemmatimonadaceae bacterium]|nr:CRISPR-associated endonuclease Cas2 [Gemmatimonadaceae bacterium]MCW5826776.1 CRISPR-associated endonuclease Cas2 [Gemmatimonadaceae bacterium]
MRHIYLVAYDVSEDKRLRRTYRKMRGFGDALQYSVFQCNLSDVERMKMVEALSGIIKHDEDRVMIVDVGPVDGRARMAFDYLGVQPEGEAERDAVIV